MKEMPVAELIETTGGNFFQAAMVVIGGLGAIGGAQQVGEWIGDQLVSMLESPPVPGADAAYSQGMAAMR